MERRHVFAGPYLDRATHLRTDPAYLAAALTDPRSLAVPVWNSRSLVTGDGDCRAALVGLARLPSGAATAERLIFLGEVAGAPCFACELDGAETPQLLDGASFGDLRTLASTLPAQDAGLLGYARAMVSWRQRHRFCGTCGAATRAAKGGHVALCSNTACGAEQFPRLDPAIIVLISDGERVLLGRQASWPAMRYSTIAGFVEPGESLEDAVRREVLEETGVRVDRVHYHSSQPWPFPASLMLGFTALAVSTEIRLNDAELEDARWFTRADLASGEIRLPPGRSISFELIRHWREADTAREA
jgi:NAD+ diphosphatase